jgi:SAM-dependent methyltransferase
VGPLAFYDVRATREFWTEHWGHHSIGELLLSAAGSPLTRLLLAALPPRGRLLEAGCGPGHYVVLLRRSGRGAFGVDLSWDALRQCRTVDAAAPVCAMDLRALGFGPASFAAYISLGVVEHDPEGPDAILREARRVLEPGGVLILSVPYVNGVRQLGRWWIRRQNRRVREAGGEFYQFAFSRSETRAFLGRNGFRVLRATPYDPARILRRLWRRVSPPRLPEAQRSPVAAPPRPGAARAVLRRLLYTSPWLHAFGHMILFVAVKAD